ncbi:uncharacterized protein LOC106065331 [Biomphalaria glabrata]|uniref:Uncharacterized protein LOC106065331 n=1 Tax=Biomphalaria glabrata TaxID=6526 RepID=A0A9W3BED5_BIOGL|nr:uncharacterized protein LOC106065331 [Biomphalaria glabrata]
MPTERNGNHTMLLTLAITLIGSVVVFGQSSNPEFRVPTHKAFNYAYMLSGTFININQENSSQNGDQNALPYDILAFTITPVVVTALQPALTFTVDQYVNGRPARYHLMTVFEDDEGLVNLKHYIIPNNLTASDVPNLQLEDIVEEAGCTAKYSTVTNKLFVGYWPACTQYEVNVPQRYVVTITCEAFTMSVPATQNQPESSYDLPYINYKIEQYPLPASVLEQAGDFQPSCAIKPEC